VKPRPADPSEHLAFAVDDQAAAGDAVPALAAMLLGIVRRRREDRSSSGRGADSKPVGGRSRPLSKLGL